MKNVIDLVSNMDSEQSAIEEGFKRLVATSIKRLVVGKQFMGAYLNGFQYIASINDDGSLEGKNNYQHYDVGRWTIDSEKHTLNVSWEYGWDNTQTHLYVIENEIRMYDLETGVWRSSFVEEIAEPKNIKDYQFLGARTKPQKRGGVANNY